MLPKKLRLDPKLIPSVAKKGKKYGNQFIFCKVLFEKTLQNSLFAISVSVKISKSAVIRNKIKRKLREMIIKANNLNLPKGKYLIIASSLKIKDVRTEDLTKSFLDCLRNV